MKLLCILITRRSPSLLVNFIYRPFSFFHPKSDLGLSRSNSNAGAECTEHLSPHLTADHQITSLDKKSPIPSAATLLTPPSSLNSTTAQLRGKSGVSKDTVLSQGSSDTSSSCNSREVEAQAPLLASSLQQKQQQQQTQQHSLLSSFGAGVKWLLSWVPVPRIKIARLVKECMLLGPAKEMHCTAGKSVTFFC